MSGSPHDSEALEADWSQVLHWRVARQGLGSRDASETHLSTAQLLCGIHAQLMSSAELCIWARVNGFESGETVRALFDTRSLVKAWAMRSTLHLFAASDYPDVLAALRTKRGYNDGILREIGITALEMETVTEAIGRALDGRCLTRTELSEEVRRLTRSRRLADLVLQSWGDTLKPAAFRGYLCSGPSRGRNVTFVRPDQWLPHWRDSIIADPLAAIFLRYLRVYGPASRDDFARWWGTAPPVVGQLIERVRPELQPVNIEGYRAWMLRKDIAEFTSFSSSTAMRMVPAFDAFVVSSFLHADRLLADDVPKTRVYRPQGWVSPVVLAGGRFAGIWKHEARGRGTIRVELFGRLRRDAVRDLKAEVERLRAFLGFRGEVEFE